MQVNRFVSGVLLGAHPSRKLRKHDGSKIHLAACKKQAMLSDSTQKPQILDMLQRGKRFLFIQKTDLWYNTAKLNRGVSHYRILPVSRDIGWPVQQLDYFRYI